MLVGPQLLSGRSAGLPWVGAQGPWRPTAGPPFLTLGFQEKWGWGTKGSGWAGKGLWLGRAPQEPGEPGSTNSVG